MCVKNTAGGLVIRTCLCCGLFSVNERGLGWRLCYFEKV